MEVTSARARLVESSGDRASAALATIPASEVEEALRLEEAPELILDVTRFTGEGEEQTTETGQVSVLWDKQDLEALLRRAEGGSVTLAFDANALHEAFDADVEGHGLRESAALLAVAVVAGGGYWAGGASAQVDQTTGTGGSATIEQVRSDAAAPPGAAIEAVRSAAATGATVSPAADIEAVRLAEGAETIAASASTPSVADIEAVRLAEGTETIAASAPTPGVADIEAVRLAEGTETIAASAPTSAISEIEAIRAHEIAVSLGGPSGAESVEAARSAEIAASVSSAEGSSTIEAVRSAAAEATRTAADTGGGVSVSMPDPAVIGFLAGGIALLITGAAFAAQRQRMRPA